MSETERNALLRDVRQALLELVADGVDYLPRPDPRRSAAALATATSAEPAPLTSALMTSGGASDATSSASSPTAQESDDELAKIRADLGDCTRCRLHEGRKQIVFGEGSPRAPVVFVGEGPGAEEDRTGRPFVGRAGELLTRMINAVGWERDDVYICNIVKCRPPQNRDPQLDEVATCRTFLERQLGAIRPHVIVTLGKPAASTLLGRPVAITKARGIWQEWNGIPLMPTFHPAYLLRNYTRETRQAVWDDLQAVRARADDETAD